MFATPKSCRVGCGLTKAAAETPCAGSRPKRASSPGVGFGYNASNGSITAALKQGGAFDAQSGSGIPPITPLLALSLGTNAMLVEFRLCLSPS